MVLIVSVLLQVGKGASIGSAFGGAGSQTLFGSSGPASLLTKVTAACAIIFMATSLYLTITSGQKRRSSIMRGLPAITVPATETTEPGAPPAPDEAGAEAPVVEPGQAKAPGPAARKAPAVKEPAPVKAEEGPGSETKQ
jgi:preprotein translocase subunit SecG